MAGLGRAGPKKGTSSRAVTDTWRSMRRESTRKDKYGADESNGFAGKKKDLKSRLCKQVERRTNNNRVIDVN